MCLFQSCAPMLSYQNVGLDCRWQTLKLTREGFKHVKMGNGCVPYYCYP